MPPPARAGGRPRLVLSVERGLRQPLRPRAGGSPEPQPRRPASGAPGGPVVTARAAPWPWSTEYPAPRSRNVVSSDLSDLTGDTCSVEEAAEVLGVGRTPRLRNARRAELPGLLRLGRLYRVSVPALRSASRSCLSTPSREGAGGAVNKGAPGCDDEHLAEVLGRLRGARARPARRRPVGQDGPGDGDQRRNRGLTARLTTLVVAGMTEEEPDDDAEDDVGAGRRTHVVGAAAGSRHGRPRFSAR